MTTVASILDAKAIRHIVTVAPSATVAQAAQTMAHESVGAIVVEGADGAIVGIFTERDLLKRVVAAARDPKTTTIGDVMTAQVRRIESTVTVADAVALMVVHGHRHVLVQDGETVRGLISIRDLMSALVAPDRPIAAEGRVGVIRARAQETIRTVQDLAANPRSTH